MDGLTFYGGVNEIGGNKILLEDRGTRIFLDFGMSFSRKGLFFEEFLTPRGAVTGIKDYLEMKLIPDITGVYRTDLVKLLGRPVEDCTVHGLFISHAHADHLNYASFLHEDVPVFMGELTHRLVKDAIEKSQNRKFEFEITNYKKRSGKGLKASDQEFSRVIHEFRTRESIQKIDDIQVTPVHVDHSIPGAYGFIINAPDARIVYTGDFRRHGKHPEMTEEFIAEACREKTDYLIMEGTRLGRNTDETKTQAREDGVKEHCCSEIKDKDAKGLVIVDFNFKDVDRFNTFFSIAEETSRFFVLSPKEALILKAYSEDKMLKDEIPKLSHDLIRIYKPRKTKYDPYENDFYDNPNVYFDDGTGHREPGSPANVWTAEELNENASKSILFLSFYDLNELVDILPPPGSVYIHSRSEAFNEEMEIDQQRLQSWLTHFELRLVQSHCSGHASEEEIRKVIEEINPQKVIPIHTEHPERFLDFPEARDKVDLPKLGKPIPL
jgi:ribonuclease J